MCSTSPRSTRTTACSRTTRASACTSACESKITYIDGDAGVLMHRGYPIEQLAEKSSFMEVCYLLLNGDLPKKAQLEKFNDDIRHHTMLNEIAAAFLQRLPPQRAPHGHGVRGHRLDVRLLPRHHGHP